MPKRSELRESAATLAIAYGMNQMDGKRFQSLIMVLIFSAGD